MLLRKFFYLLLLFSTFSYAQQKGSLSGKVIDKTTGEPLINAEVIIKETGKGTTTNEKGFYSLPSLPKSSYTIGYYYLGYQSVSKRITINGDAKQNISLTPQKQEIGEVVFTAKTIAHQKKEEAMPVTVIDLSNMRGTVSSVQDILIKTVGVTIRSTGGVGSSSRLSVRGLEGKRIGFFIDELPLSEQSDYLDINDIPVDMIDRIEIYKGVVPARFGGSSLGGAVNIVIREYPEKYADLSYGLESFNTHKLQAVLKEKGLIFGVGGSYTTADNNYTF